MDTSTPWLASPDATWLREALERIRSTGVTSADFYPFWNAAGRRLGRTPVALSAADETAFAFSPRGWGADEYGRALILVTAFEVEPRDRHVALVDGLFRTGELREQRALLRVLSHLPSPERFVTVGVEAVRSNATAVIEAIACDNSYPRDHFDEDAFNQMVLKCLFVGLSLPRVRGLESRRTLELVRMVTAYASERRTAGRAIPKDALLVMEGETDAPV
jgi:hypothetical protein